MSSIGEKMASYLDRGEDFPREPIPQSERKPWWSIGMVWTGVYVSMAGILDGLAVIGGLSFYKGIVALLIGFFIFLALTALQGSVGTETGLSTYMIARDSFGLKGSQAVSLISFVVNFGWYAINTRALAESVAVLAGGGNVNALCFIFGLLMMITAILGYKGIEALSTPAVIYTFFFMIISTIRVFASGHVSFTEIVTRAPLGEPLSFATVVSIIVGAMAAGAVNAPDIMRFSRKSKDNFKGLYIIGLPLAIMQPIAAMLLALAAGSSDFATVMLEMGGFWGFIMIVLGAWTSNDNALYSSSLALSEVIKGVKRWKLAIIIGIVASILTSFIDLSMYADLMLLMGAFTIPIIGITLSDFYILPKIGLDRGLALKNGENINMAAIITWIAGGVLEASLDFGVIPNKTGIPGVVLTVLLATVLYTIIMKIKYQNKVTVDK